MTQPVLRARQADENRQILAENNPRTISTQNVSEINRRAIKPIEKKHPITPNEKLLLWPVMVRLTNSWLNGTGMTNLARDYALPIRRVEALVWHVITQTRRQVN